MLANDLQMHAGERPNEVGAGQSRQRRGWVRSENCAQRPAAVQDLEQLATVGKGLAFHAELVPSDPNATG